MAYSHYQTSQAWGTPQYQFPPPPAFQAQPQPNWGGMDYYNAHAVNPDSSLYEHAWNGVRQYSSSILDQDEIGVGVHEAKHWHRKAYGGLGELTQMLPSEIGHAAAYEAYRTWIHNSSISEPLSGDVERQREGLTGLAVAEASRLLQFSGHMDSYARMEASEAAAATASIIFYHTRSKRDGEYGRGRSRAHSRSRDDGDYGRLSRRGSFSSAYDDPYALDSRVSSSFGLSRPRSHSRHRARSSSRHSPMIPYQGSAMGGGSAVSASMPIPSVDPNNGGGAYGAYGTPGSFNAPMQIQGQGSSYGAPMQMPGQSYGVPMQIQGQGSSYGAPMQIAGQGSSYGAPMQMPGRGPSYGGGMMPSMNQPYNSATVARPRSNSMSYYGQPQYPQAQYAQAQGQYMAPYTGASQQQPTIILTGSGHRKHRKKHHKRSKSSSRY